ncbi:MAG: PIN domain-containing protein, partial [Anaerolineae bacterium]|nr:PIN domain-containing protein [Anaerolineae bacterium]
SERGRGLVQAQKALGLIEQLPLEVVDAGKERVLAAAHIKARYPVAYADAFAAGLAQEFGGTVLTDDPEFGSLKDLISVRRLGGE